MTARVRVYLSTYRRPGLLRRAVESLRAQTLTDWACELHNDAPDDPEPARLVADIGDPRICCVTHATNLGATRAFNLFHQPVAEPYFSLLEDDNWWDPRFLERMVETLDTHRDVELAWANLQLWREEPDGSWRDTGQAIWQVDSRQTPVRIAWPQLLQATNALHSNGAMLVRTQHAHLHHIPDDTPQDSMEFVRERTYDAVLFVPDVLGAFAITQGTSRSKTRLQWDRTQFLLLLSFLDHVPLTAAALAQLWALRRGRARSTHLLFVAAFSRARHLRLLGHARVADWFAFARLLVGRPALLAATMRARRAQPALWAFLDTQTKARFATARAGGLERLDVGGIERRGELPARYRSS
jgi:hypothetical protein